MAPVLDDLEPEGYQRPSAPAYRTTPGERQYSGDILLSLESQIQRAILKVVDVEAPLHREDLVARVAGMWGSRMGSRIRQRIEKLIHTTAQHGLLIEHDNFIWRPDGLVRVRSRNGTRIPPERVAPEEYREAILLVLGAGSGLTQSELTNEVRALLGFGRATESVHRAVDEQLRLLLGQRVVGEGSQGFTLRS